MAKRKVKRSSRSPKRQASRKSNTQPHLKSLRIADILVSIAVAFTLINSVLVIFYADTAAQKAAELGLQMPASNWQMLGAAWLFLALFAYMANKMIRDQMKDHLAVGLLIIGIILGILGRIESAVLIIISSVIYLRKAKRK